PYDQLTHTYIVVLVVNPKCNHVFSRRQRLGKISEGLGLGVDDPILWKDRAPLFRLVRNLLLIQSRRWIGRIDSNPDAAAINSFLPHRDSWRSVINRER